MRWLRMKKKSDFNVSVDDMMFQEEVKDEELHSKLGTSDIIYENGSARRRRTGFLIFLSVLLILLSIFSIFFGFAYLDKDLSDKGNVTTVKYDLFVVHSNSDYGGVISSFDKYNSMEKAYSYDFSVSNKNPVSLNYSVSLFALDFGNNNIDMTKINYALYKDNVVVQEGILSNVRELSLYDNNCASNTTNEYSIKLWSLTLGKDSKFKFRININV